MAELTVDELAGTVVTTKIPLEIVLPATGPVVKEVAVAPVALGTVVTTKMPLDVVEPADGPAA